VLYASTDSSTPDCRLALRAADEAGSDQAQTEFHAAHGGGEGFMLERRARSTGYTIPGEGDVVIPGHTDLPAHHEYMI
jgi:hypothetical protein